MGKVGRNRVHLRLSVVVAVCAAAVCVVAFGRLTPVAAGNEECPAPNSIPGDVTVVNGAPCVCIERPTGFPLCQYWAVWDPQLVPNSDQYCGIAYQANGNPYATCRSAAQMGQVPIHRVPANSITKVPDAVPQGTSATSVLANLTMVDGVGPGYITADQCANLSAAPQARSNGNHSADLAIANLSVIPVDQSRSFCVYNQTRQNLVADVQGYFASPQPDGLTFTPLGPTRLLDTRVTPSSSVAGGTITKVSTGAAGANAVLVNLAMTDGVLPGYITADKCSTMSSGPQAKSNGNHGIGTAISNLAIVPIDADGSFCVYNQQQLNLIVDLQGSFTAPSPTGLRFSLVSQSRVLDTRSTGPRVPPGSLTRVQTGVAAGTAAALVNLTMVDGAGPGYVTADKCSAMVAGPQDKSSGNHAIATAIANLAVVPVDPDGSFCLFNAQAVNLVVDVQGEFGIAGSQYFVPVAPHRVLDTRR